MKRSPVPEVRARSFCVTRRLLRTCRIVSPSCAAVYFTIFYIAVTDREYFTGFTAKSNGYYRSGIH